jgi:hypothetical protein
LASNLLRFGVIANVEFYQTNAYDLISFCPIWLGSSSDVMVAAIATLAQIFAFSSSPLTNAP